jgi:hypothetical protein
LTRDKITVPTIFEDLNREPNTIDADRLRVVESAISAPSAVIVSVHVKAAINSCIDQWRKKAICDPKSIISLFPIITAISRPLSVIFVGRKAKG